MLDREYSTRIKERHLIFRNPGFTVFGLPYEVSAKTMVPEVCPDTNSYIVKSIAHNTGETAVDTHGVRLTPDYGLFQLSCTVLFIRPFSTLQKCAIDCH